MQNSIKVGVSLLVLGVGMSQANANLVGNGGFETGDFTDWNVIPATSGAFLGVVGGLPHSGTYTALFGETSGIPDTIQQAIPTTVGLTYHVEFWVNTDNPGQGGGDLTAEDITASTRFFEATFGGVTLLTLADNPAAPYTLYSGDVVAASGSSLLTFRSFNGPGFYYLDDVSVAQTEGSQVPEASTTAALTFLAGFVGFTIWRRRARA